MRRLALEAWQTALRLSKSSLHQQQYPRRILKAMNYEEGGTTIDRNGQIGGHKE